MQRAAGAAGADAGDARARPSVARPANDRPADGAGGVDPAGHHVPDGGRDQPGDRPCRARRLSPSPLRRGALPNDRGSPDPERDLGGRRDRGPRDGACRHRGGHRARPLHVRDPRCGLEGRDGTRPRRSAAWRRPPAAVRSCRTSRRAPRSRSATPGATAARPAPPSSTRPAPSRSRSGSSNRAPWSPTAAPSRPGPRARSA